MSRATMVDSQPEEETVEDTEENEAQGIQQEDFVEQPQKEPTVPEKYQGKSLEQVVQMHQEAEKLLGRQSSEVGELRKVVDDYIRFAEWIKASKIRTQLFVEADQQFNAEAADELFSLWKERKTVAEQTVKVEKQARKQQIKAANTGNMQGSGEASRRKVYRRADIIKLMKTDPERYQALSEEIFRAYAEGRVK
jgi:hypothetical protein